MSMDPYEQQYQQYFNQQADSVATNVRVKDDHSTNTRSQTDAYSSYSFDQGSFQGQSAATNNMSYESQLLQYYTQQSPVLPKSYPEPSPWETTSSSEPSTPPIETASSGASSWNADPYQTQYQQYFQSYQGIQTDTSQTISWDQPASYYEPTSVGSTQHHPPEMATEQDTSSEVNREDEFLKMLSTEVQYKKLLGQNPYALTDIELPVLIQRVLDNIEDATQKNNGKLKGQDRLKGQKKPKDERKTVLVLGTGWAAHAFIKLASTYDLRIVVFTPMLASAAVGTVEYRSMTEPIRVTNPNIDNYVEGRAIGVDVSKRKVAVQLTSLSTVTGAFKGPASNAPCRLEPEPVLTRIIYDENDGVQRDASQGAGDVIELSYDYLICAVGTAARSTIVPGAKEYCFNLKTSLDSKRLRTAIGEALEFASRPDVQEFYYLDGEQKIAAQNERRRRVKIAIVGGGPTGVCRYPDGAYQHLRDDISIMLIHGGSEVLPAMDPELRERGLRALQEQGVDLRLNTRLKEVGRDYIRIGEKGSDFEDIIPVGLTVWAAGNAPVPFVKELLSQLPESAAGSGGRINVDDWLRCPTPTEDSFGSILVLGDIACRERGSKYDPTPQPLPQTAQVAGQQGAYAARMLNRGYDLQQTPPKLPELSAEEGFSLLRLWLLARGLEEAPGFDFLSLGLLAYVGQEEALNQVQLGDVPLFNYSGKIAFALWRSVYLAKQASTRNQALIAFDWLRTNSFGRDITRL
eukprot:scaffold1813_cov109-Cylindrotheca_fusiformis.AAC.5